jgi:hypothetical protein
VLKRSYLFCHPSVEKKLAANPCIFSKTQRQLQISNNNTMPRFEIPGDPIHLAYGYSNFSGVFLSVFDNRLQYNDCAPDAVNAVSASIGVGDGGDLILTYTPDPPVLE